MSVDDVLAAFVRSFLLLESADFRDATVIRLTCAAYMRKRLDLAASRAGVPTEVLITRCIEHIAAAAIEAPTVDGGCTCGVEHDPDALKVELVPAERAVLSRKQ